MTPFLSPLSGAVGVCGVAPPPRKFLPPPSFRPVFGTPRSVAFSAWQPPKSRGRTPAQKAGIRFEKKVLEGLSQQFGPAFRAHPSITFVDDSGRRAAVPDGLLRLHNDLVIVEVKYSHTDLAWWQLRKLYEPLLQQLTWARIFLLEVCKTYDPGVALPEEHFFLPSLSSSFTSAPLHVLQWKT